MRGISFLNTFLSHVDRHTGQPGLFCRDLELLQVNLGLRCNLECHHCHVAASPRRKEAMSREVMDQVLALSETSGCRKVDITGGAPELHPHFREFVTALHDRGLEIQVRTNLVVHLEAGMEWVAPLLRDLKVQLVGSMPCYLETNVTAQRGPGVYQGSIMAMRRLNELGYGRSADLRLDLVYNPGGPFLPPMQCRLEADYRRELHTRFGLDFTSLLTIANMPIGRFRADLRQQGREDQYRALLQDAFNPATLEGLMCRHQVSIAWDGTLYDCDFNLALGLPLATANRLEECRPEVLAQRPIVTGDHCFGCTAGSGSSCRGALVA
ncbi:MAG: arsenosugar biosynthesis radical SAM protein ArsS [Magnetococcales bacterium]|nr:arsenosugar biosynthesis radical SAM protein ArsS [Magnetococcales bacterium]